MIVSAQRCMAVFFVCLALLLPGQALATFAFSVTRTHIENALLLYFPLRNYTAAAKLTLAKPSASLETGSRKLQLVIPVTARIPSEGRRRGQLNIAVGFHYKAATGELFLGTPHIQSFLMADISAEHYNSFYANLADMLAKTLPMVRIYQVKERDLNHSLAKSEMRSMIIEKGLVNIIIGFK